MVEIVFQLRVVARMPRCLSTTVFSLCSYAKSIRIIKAPFTAFCGCAFVAGRTANPGHAPAGFLASVAISETPHLTSPSLFDLKNPGPNQFNCSTGRNDMKPTTLIILSCVLILLLSAAAAHAASETLYPDTVV